ncbi:uridine kinase family protein [Nocardioides bruguierae]|uniref:uridine kinase family protein n=1 Tax=Nocardioides bruguierae TaxID=2945102 RepID=UPI0020208070|nr:4-amino-4-deoxy-L-arabinose transferase [Nocardioides bruguierae]MCL8027520.1 4-amino-4-deoxy-L-arabinose transferase [Nocardioides bruguierae]
MALARPAQAPTPRVLALDGRSGAGKTVLADRVVAVAGDRGLRTALVHMDDLYEGWEGLPGSAPRLAGLLAPVAEGRTGTCPRWDWHAGTWQGEVVVPPVDLVVVEGVGSGTRLLDGLRTLLVWLEAPVPVRRERGLARDGDAFAPWWDAWAAAEEAHLAAEDTTARADVLVDGTGSAAPVVR